MTVMCALFATAPAVALSGMKDTAGKFDTFIEKDPAFLSASATLYARGLQMGQALRNSVLDHRMPPELLPTLFASLVFAHGWLLPCYELSACR